MQNGTALYILGEKGHTTTAEALLAEQELTNEQGERYALLTTASELMPAERWVQSDGLQRATRPAGARVNRAVNDSAQATNGP